MLTFVRRYVGGLQCFSCVAARHYTPPTISGNQCIPKFLLSLPSNDLCNLPYPGVVPLIRLEIDQLGYRGHCSVTRCVGPPVLEMQLASI